MAKPATRSQFADYCLRRLGSPVINIEVAPEQIDDCIDEALSYYADYHFDGSSKVYLKHQITAEDKSRGWISTPSEFTGVTGILPVGGTFSSAGMFDVRYQFALNEMINLSSFSMVDYYMNFQYLNFIQELMVGRQQVRFNRHQNKLFIDMNWNKLETGQFIIIEAHAMTDPEQNPDVWSDRWLQNYAIAKIKYQWGSHLTKFQNGILPGNIQFNGDKILDEAKEEIRHLEERMQWDNMIPPDDMIG